MRLPERTALVTGGGRGIGAAIAAALAREGAAVAVAARTLDEVERVAAALRDQGYAAAGFRCDVTVPDDVHALVGAVERSLGPIDILVNNAGGATSNPIPRITLDEWRGALEVNATGTFLCTQAVLPGMLRRGFGRVVNVASVAGLEGARYVAAYTAAKHAVVGFTRAAAAEVRGRGITVNAVCPGYVDTPMTDATLARVGEKTGLGRERALARLLEEAGQPRLIRPEEVADVVVELAADAECRRNGEAVRLDGGAERSVVGEPGAAPSGGTARHPGEEGAVCGEATWRPGEGGAADGEATWRLGEGGAADDEDRTVRAEGSMFEHLNPEALGAPKGWTNGMLAPVGGRVLFVAGQDAAEREGSVEVEGFVEQFARALDKALAVVREAGGGPQHVGRMTVFVTSVAEYRARRNELGAVWRERMGGHYPAMALVEVTALVDPRARVEIEVTAVVPGRS